MKRFYLLLYATVFFLGADAQAQTLIHYWNFNNTTTEVDLLGASASIVGAPSLVYVIGGSGSGVLAGTNSDLNANLNARNADASGTHLRFNNPIGGTLTFSIPSTGYEDIIVKYGALRTTQGAGTQKISYSVNGTDFIALPDVIPTTTAGGALVTIDLSAITAADNNVNLKLRIGFEQGGGGVAGNNRIDNFTVDGTSLGPDVTAPNVTFNPVNNATSVFHDTKPTITFNEDVRLVNDAAIDNSNVDNLVELKLDNAIGAVVPFDATFTGRVITITPTNALPNAQVLYVAVKANAVEDMSGNAIVNAQSASFTTLPQQTQFQPGDIVFVAYRTNASTTDEVKFVTFVDILPGTQINFTDGKFTDNGQCPGGFTWISPANTLPAGSTVSIVVDATPPTTNKGTTTGNGFGLSSGGEQVIAYTGTAANPHHITALSTNAWVTGAHTACTGSLSKIPTGLTDGQTSLNTSTAPGATGGIAINAYYSGPQVGSPANIRASVLNPANWVTAGSGSTAQVWPAWGPEITSIATTSHVSIQLVFNSPMDGNSVVTLGNYTGIAGLQTAALEADGKTVKLLFANAFTTGASYSLVISNLKDTQGRFMDDYTFNFTYSTTIGFDKKFISVAENGGQVDIKIKVANPSSSAVDLVLKGSSYNTATANDFTYVTSRLSFEGTSAVEQVVSIPIPDDVIREQDEYFVLTLEGATGSTITGISTMTVFIKDNDAVAPVATKAIELSHVSSFDPGASTAEIVVHDPRTQRLFIISSIQDRLDIADFSNPANITLIKSVDMTPYGGITSVAVNGQNVVAASPNADDQQNGSVVFFDAEGTYKNKVTVGVLPDMITFSPDGTKVLTANEGQPNDSYSSDPEGSVSIIDISGGVASLDQSKVTTLLFTDFNAQEAALLSAGVRKLKTTSTLSQDFEPEYITIAADGKKAWVTIQESNAIAEINLETKTITSVWPLGKKDHSLPGNGIDASDNSGIVTIANWPVKSFYIPDAIAGFKSGETQYLVTANEGDEKEYAGLNERTTVGAVTLDPTVFPNAAVLKEDHNIGRLRMTKLSGDTDGDTDYDEINIPGGRSFTIWNADTKQKVFDSGDDFERITSTNPNTLAIFNADNESNAFKSRSRAKGPEPEGLVIAKLEDKVYAFIALERVGGVMVYDITDPAAPKFTDYKNSRSSTAYSGDQGPEGIIYISRENSPTKRAYIAVANEISGTVSVFEIGNAPGLPQTVTFDAVPDKTVGDPAFALTATASSTLPVTFSTTDDEVTILAGQVTIVKAGKVTVTATQPGGGIYKTAEATRAFCVNPAKPTITLTGANTANTTLQSSNASGNQWYKNGTAINGAVNATLSVNANGEGVYTVKSTVETCASALSENFPVIITGDIAFMYTQLSISPNPADDAIVIQLPGSGVKDISILNANGVAVTSKQSEKEEEVVHISDWAKGFYIVRVKTANGNHFGKFIKK